MSSPMSYAFSFGEFAIKDLASSTSDLDYSQNFQFAQLGNMDDSARTFSDMVTAASPNVAEVAPNQAVQNVSANETVQATGSATAPVDEVKATGVVGPDNTNALGAQERASRALSLPTAPAKAVTDTGGDTILNGIQKLRGVFDKQIGRINQATNGPLDNVNKVLSVQVAVAEFSMLVEVSSKLVGKSTQAFESLLKGQ